MYTEEELAPWVERIKTMRQEINEMFVVTNNHYEGQAVVNALELQHRVLGRKAHIPDELIRRYPRLAAVAL